MHNLLPVRGARCAMRCAGPTMDQALDQTQGAEIYIGSTTGRCGAPGRIRKFMTMHRDVYKYTHDQTVRLINAGYTPGKSPTP